MQSDMRNVEQMLMELADAHPELRAEVMALSDKMDDLADGPDIGQDPEMDMPPEEDMGEEPVMPGKRPIPADLQDEKPSFPRR